MDIFTILGIWFRWFTFPGTIVNLIVFIVLLVLSSAS